ncbi:MAG: conditioned medium-induced protein 4 [Halobacteriaceae archaeon]
MDNKTEELRDVFLEVTDEETVTESQEDGRGSLTTDDEGVDERLAEVVADMRERVGFGISLSDGELVTVVRRFYAGDSDTEIARELGDDSLSKTVARARLDLHLLRDSDTDAPFDLDELREAVEAGHETADLADRFDASESTVRHYRRVIEAQDEIHRVNDRYRDEFANVLRDRELTERMTEDVQQDGLDEATEGQEIDLSF